MKARIPQSGGQGNMMQQAKRLQEEMAKTQAELEEREYEGSAGGESVKVMIKGNKEFKSVTIKPEIVDPDDIEMLEDLVLIAFNDALKKSSDDSEESMSKLTGGLNIPGLM